MPTMMYSDATRLVEMDMVVILFWVVFRKQSIILSYLFDEFLSANGSLRKSPCGTRSSRASPVDIGGIYLFDYTCRNDGFWRKLLDSDLPARKWFSRIEPRDVSANDSRHSSNEMR